MEDPSDASSDDTVGPRQGHEHGASAGAPRWVRVFGLVVLVLLVLFILVHLAGGGFHGHPPPVT